MSLSLYNLSLANRDVAELPTTFGRNVTTLSVVFNNLTNIGVAGVQRQALRVSPLDLEGNYIVFALGSEGVLLLWKLGLFCAILSVWQCVRPSRFCPPLLNDG